MFEKDISFLQGALAQGEFIAAVYDGSNIAEACARLRVNPAALGFVRRDNPDFDAAIRAAQAFRVDLMVDRLEHIEDEESDALMARVISDNIKWLASKRLREIYGEKVDVSHNHTINLVDAIAQARARTIPFINGKSLEIIDASTDNVSVALQPNNIEPTEKVSNDPFD